MGNTPSVVLNVQLQAVAADLPYLNRALLTFVPNTPEFLAGFQSLAKFKDPNTNLGLVDELRPNDWAARMKALGALPDEPTYRHVDAHFNQVGFPDPITGLRARSPKPPYLYIGMRTDATVTIKTLEYTTNTIGSTTYRILPAPKIFTTQTPPGALATFTVTADGILTPTQLALAFQTAFNLAIDPSIASAAPGGAGESVVTSNTAGYPIVIVIVSTSPGPIVTQTDDTSVLALAYAGDLDRIKFAAETTPDPSTMIPTRRWYAITDLQNNDLVNAQGYAWVEAQKQLTPPSDYQFFGWSSDLLNFDTTSPTSPAKTANAANGGGGWTRSNLQMKKLWEALPMALLGRTLGLLPGEVSFNDRVLDGSTANAKMTPEDWGDAESQAQTDKFNYYSAEGPKGASHWGYLANGSYIDRVWIEDYTRYLGTKALVQWKQLNNITSYDDDAIVGGAGIIRGALAKLPALVPDTIVVTYKTRIEVDPNNIVNRVYVDYYVTAQARGQINQIGTNSTPIEVVISETPA